MGGGLFKQTQTGVLTSALETRVAKASGSAVSHLGFKSSLSPTSGTTTFGKLLNLSNLYFLHFEN